MNVDEAERRRGRLYDGIDAVLTHAVVRVEQRLQKIVEVLRACADEFGQRVAVVVALSEKHAVGPQADMDEPGIFDQDAPGRAAHFIDAQFVLFHLPDAAAPTFKPVARRALALDLEARAAVGQQQEARGARDEVAADSSDRLRRLACRALRS